MNDNILKQIIANKQIEIAIQEKAVPISFLENIVNDTKPAYSLKQYLQASPTGIIAEFKRRSPSKGWICQYADASNIPASYQQAGAAALSILTDETYFGGNVKDICIARPNVSLPILRKDFIFSRYQLLQTKAIHADAVLLIAAMLTPQTCRTLAHYAHELHLEVLLELHNEQELDYLNEYIDVIGINNRDLKTFHTDVGHSLRLAEQLPQDIIRISESGISTPNVIRKLREAGFNGFLIGETFMKTTNPGETLKQFIQDIAL